MLKKDENNTVTGTMKGIAQQKSVNPYVKNPAEMMSDQAGINVRGLGDTVVTEIDKGDWVKVSSVNFSKGASQIVLTASSKSGCALFSVQISQIRFFARS